MVLPGQSRLDEPVSFPKTDDEWHSFLLPDQGSVDRLEILIKLREYMEDLPPTKATFEMSDALDNGEWQAVLDDRMLYLVGTWRVPDLIKGTSSPLLVNPHSEHAHYYSDAVVECGCGAVVVRENFSENQPQPLQEQSHTEDCHKINRHEMRLELLKNRRDIIEEMIGAGLSFRQMAPRLGYKGSKDVVPTVARNCGLDPHELQYEARRRMIRTFMVLAREYSPETIGKLYDLNRRSVSDAIRHESKADPATLYSVRRRRGSAGGLKGTA